MCIMNNLDLLFDSIVSGKLEPALEITRQAISENIEPQFIINDYMIRAMEEIGRRFGEGKAFVPELLMAARAMKGPLDLLKPLLKSDASATAGKVVIGTVKGDLHDIGKNLVASMLEGCGFEVVNIGIDIPAERFVSAIRDENADILCMSALLTTTMSYMETVIAAVVDAGLRDKIKIMVGGAPVTESFAVQIGADGFSYDANEAVAVAKRLMADRQNGKMALFDDKSAHSTNDN